MRNWRETFRRGKIKKLLAGIIAFMLMLNSSAPVWAETDVSASGVTWTLEHTVDDFGDESGNPVIQCIVDGKFSNTATSGSNLKVVVYVIADDMGSIVGKGNYALAFRLLEYGDHVATYTSSEDKILKTKIGDTVEEYKLLGSAPKGDLYVDFIGVDINTKEGLQDYIYDNTINYGEVIAKQLVEGNDIKCAVLIGSSKYNFTLEAGNIKAVFAELMEDGEHKLPLGMEDTELSEESVDSNANNESNIEVDNRMIDYIKENGEYAEVITVKDQCDEKSFSGYRINFMPEGANEKSKWALYADADYPDGFWYESIYSSAELSVNNTVHFSYPNSEMEFTYYYEVPDGWTDVDGNQSDFRGTFYLTIPIESYKSGQDFSTDTEVLEFLDKANNAWKRIEVPQKMGDDPVTEALNSMIKQLQIYVEKDTNISMSDLGFVLGE